MKIALVILTTVFSAQAFAAKNLTCTLQSGKSTSSATMKLAPEMDMSEDNDNVYTGEDLDLSLVMMGTCEGTQCSVDAVILSQIVEDEVGSLNFEFSMNDKGIVFEEPLTEAPDHREYLLTCEVR